MLQVDASDTRLRGALLQEGPAVDFTTSTLSATEINYPPIEKMFDHQSSMHQVLPVPVSQERCCSSFKPPTT